MASTGGVKLGSDYDAARTRKMNAEAELAELELERVHGTLVVAEDVVDAWNDVLTALKAKLLSVPSKAAPVVSTEHDSAICKDILEDLINEALEELANYDPKTDPTKASVERTDEVDVDVKATKKTNSKRVGRPKKTTRLAK